MASRLRRNTATAMQALSFDFLFIQHYEWLIQKFLKEIMKKIIAAGGLVFNDKNELLMIFRRGKWDLPKGKLDEGESIEACAVREVQEETGLNVELQSFIGLTYHEYFDKYSEKDVI